MNGVPSGRRGGGSFTLLSTATTFICEVEGRDGIGKDDMGDMGGMGELNTV